MSLVDGICFVAGRAEVCQQRESEELFLCVKAQVTKATYSSWTYALLYHAAAISG